MSDLGTIAKWVTDLTHAEDLIARIKEQGGATWTWRHDGFPDSGYMVSVPGAEEITKLSAFGPEHILSYEERHLLEPGQYWGAWVHEGHVYLDKSVHFASRRAALTLARSWDQLGVYDIAAEATIDTGVERAA